MVTSYSYLQAYEVDTHERFSVEAYLASDINMAKYTNDEWFSLFGFNKGQTFKLVDPVVNTPLLSMPEITNHPDTGAPISPATADLLMSRGAIIEDENDRPLRHFLDPQNGNRGITYGLQFNSADWALEDNITTSFQRMSYADLTDYYFKSASASSVVDRQKYMGFFWQGIGHLIHHIQDMAQPQHVRNDAHCNKSDGIFNNCKRIDNITGLDLYQPSQYEFYSKLILTPTKIADIYRSSLYYGGGQGFNFGQHGFTTPRDFWLSPNQGQAIFVSRNFVTVDTNYRAVSTGASLPNLQYVDYTTHPQFPLPSQNSGSLPNIIERVTLTNEDICDPGQPVNNNCLISGDFYFVKRAFIDPVTNEEHYMNRFSSFGLWDDELAKQGKKPIFSLNRLNYLDRYSVLVPRAVGFSQGLIDFIFRGKISAAVNNGQLTIKNDSSYSMAGTIYSYSDRSNGVRNAHQSITINLAPGQQTVILDAATYFPDDNAYTGWRTLVFKGNIGGSPGVASYHLFYESQASPNPVPCGSNITGRSGSSEGFYPPPVNLGSEAGTVQVAFEAYRIPDGYEVRRSADNQVLKSTNGLVSGYHLDSFEHNPDPNDPTTFLVDLEVTGNSDDDTLWDITLGCPGDSVPDSRKTVNFDVQGQGGNQCSASLYIDDDFKQIIYPSSSDFNLQLSAGSNGNGFHEASLRYIAPGCEIGTSSSYFTIFINQGGNTIGSLGVPTSSTTNFYVD